MRALRDEIESLNSGLAVKAQTADFAVDIRDPEAGQGYVLHASP